MLYLTHSDSPAELRPARALLTPTWIGALALLVVNDHFFKGSGLLPGVLTGKLSDFAGMLVAPTLLAALIGVRTRGALLACHVAVAAVFTGIQLSTGFAAQWSALMGLFGYPWVITCDPTDLLALPFLLLSWKLLVPEMNPELPALVPLQRTAVGALSMFGLWSTVATSAVDEFPDPNDGTWYEDVFGNIYINNANDFEIALHIRPLRDDVMIDCQQVATDPGRLLSEDAFGDAVHWSLPAWTNVGIELPGNECGAVWVAGEGIDPTILFVDYIPGNWPQWFPGQDFDIATNATPGLGIQFDAQGGTWVGNTELRFVPKTETPEQSDSCEPPSDELRFDWPLMVPKRDVQVLGIEAGVDGCFELELQEWFRTTMPNGEPGQAAAFGEPYSFYLCAPAAAVPFAADDFLRFTELGSNTFQLLVTLLDGETLEPALDDQGRFVRQVRYLRGLSEPQAVDAALGQSLVAIDRFSCSWLLEAEGCASVERPVDLAVSGGQSFLQPGVPVAWGDKANGMVHTAVLGYARQLAVVDLACAEGSVQLPYDLDMAIIDEPLL